MTTLYFGYNENIEIPLLYIFPPFVASVRSFRTSLSLSTTQNKECDIVTLKYVKTFPNTIVTLTLGALRFNHQTSTYVH